MSISREHLHRLIDEIEPDYLNKVYKILLVFADGDEWVADNSPLTEEEKKAIRESEEHIAKGDVVSWEDIKREFNL